MRFLLILTIILLPSLVLACPPIKGDKVDAQLVTAFQDIANKAQAPCPAYFTLDGRGGAMVEYLPEGESLDTWKNMMTANLIYTGSPSHDSIISTADNLVKIYEKAGGKAEVLPKGEEGANGPMRSIRYEIGKGAGKEHAIAVVRVFADDKVVVFQKQRRGGDLSVAEVKAFQDAHGIK